MELSTAISLIRPSVSKPSRPQQWADLGAGSGLFTRALATCLAPGSKILAFDREPSTGTAIIQDVVVEQRIADFIIDELPKNLDGVLMANSLHFVENKFSFLGKLRNSLSVDGKLVVIEYDVDAPNRWVPFPVSYQTLASEFANSFKTIRKIGHTGSVYNQAGMYSAEIAF